MNDCFESSGRVILLDQSITQDMEGMKFVNHQFQRLVAKDKRFINCDFKYSEFDAAYIRKCVFISCDFTGCKFVNSNLRGSSFKDCNFDYSLFNNTHVEQDILDENLSDKENMQRSFARTLRLNFQQIGDPEAVNKAIKIELDATSAHYYKAWHSREYYYRKKYAGIERAKMFVKWLSFKWTEWIWGNGENPYQLLLPFSFLVILIAGANYYCYRDETEITTVLKVFLEAPGIFLGLASGNFPDWLLIVIAILRYILLAMLVSILIKRMSKR